MDLYNFGIYNASKRRIKMTLKEQIKTDFMSAFKARQMEKKNFLGLIKSAIETEEKNTGSELSDADVTKILKKFAKNLNESINAGGALDSVTQMQLELDIVEAYLPAQMSEEEITSIVETLIANGASNMGQIMGTFNKEYSGQADNKLVSQIARQKLS